MERLLILIGAGLALIMLVYASAMRHTPESPSLQTLSSQVPDDPWYRETVLDSELPVLVEFTATWCGYCKQLAVVLKDIEKEYGDQIKIVPVDVDEHPAVAEAYGIDGYPTVLVIKQGKVVAYAPGMMRYETVEQLIKPHLVHSTSGKAHTPAHAAPFFGAVELADLAFTPVP